MMTDIELEELQAKERSLWLKIQAAKTALAPIEAEWGVIFSQINRERMKREIAKELANKTSMRLSYVRCRQFPNDR